MLSLGIGNTFSYSRVPLVLIIIIILHNKNNLRITVACNCKLLFLAHASASWLAKIWLIGLGWIRPGLLHTSLSFLVPVACL
jgi:hypothetical protein